MKRLMMVWTVMSLSVALHAQKKSKVQPVVQKQPLTHGVYDQWKDISYKALTPDGNYAAFTVNPQDGDGKVVFYGLKNSVQDSVRRADNILLMFDSRYAVFKIKPQQKLVKDLRR